MNRVERETIRNWSRNVEFEARVYRPKTEADVIAILNDHADGRNRLRVVGSKHSMNDIAKSDAVIDMSAFNTISPLQRGAKTVTVGAGVTLKALQDELARFDLTLPARGTIKLQTIAGAISTGTHGSGKTSLSNFVMRVRIASYKSGIAQASDVDSGEDLLAVRTALGAMGVILEVTLSVRDGYFIEQGLEMVSTLEEVIGRTGSEPAYPLQLFIRFPYDWRYVVSRRRESNRGPRGIKESLCRHVRRVMNEKVKDGALPWLIKHWVAPSSSGRIQRFYRWVLPRLLMREGRVFDDDDNVQTMRHEWFSNQDIELFVPESELRSADEWLKHIISAFANSSYVLPENIAKSLEKVRFTEALAPGSYTHHAPLFYQRVLPDETLISMTAGAEKPYYSVIVLSYLPPRPNGTFERFAKFVGEGLVQIFHARAHWGKYFPLGVGDLERNYGGKVARFREICEMYDPNGVFRNEFTTRALGLAPQRRGGEVD